ncbi:hypothetical protein Hanom_Chr14g01315111 [Helianthus anomalus]
MVVCIQNKLRAHNCKVKRGKSNITSQCFLKSCASSESAISRSCKALLGSTKCSAATFSQRLFKVGISLFSPLPFCKLNAISSVSLSL